MEGIRFIWIWTYTLAIHQILTNFQLFGNPFFEDQITMRNKLTINFKNIDMNTKNEIFLNPRHFFLTKENILLSVFVRIFSRPNANFRSWPRNQNSENILRSRQSVIKKYIYSRSSIYAHKKLHRKTPHQSIPHRILRENISIIRLILVISFRIYIFFITDFCIYNILGVLLSKNKLLPKLPCYVYNCF